MSSGDGECYEDFKDLKCAEPKRLPHSKLRPKGFLQEKTGNYLLSECLDFSFADAFYLKSLTLHQLQGLSPMWLSTLLKGEIGILYLDHLDQTCNLCVISPDSQTIILPPSVYKTISNCHGNCHNSIGKVGGGLVVCACWFLKVSVVSSTDGVHE